MFPGTEWRHVREDLIVPQPWVFIRHVFDVGGYTIDAKILPPGPTGNRRMLWRVHAGEFYLPDTHTYPHFLRFLQGEGIVRVGSDSIRYVAPNGSVMVKAGVPHYLADIIKDTIVLQIIPPA